MSKSTFCLIKKSLKAFELADLKFSCFMPSSFIIVKSYSGLKVSFKNKDKGLHDVFSYRNTPTISAPAS